jgi:hypothetical protein
MVNILGIKFGKYHHLLDAWKEGSGLLEWTQEFYQTFGKTQNHFFLLPFEDLYV